MHDHPHNLTDATPDILNPRRAMLAGLGGLAAGALLASTANAGPLTPPAGPIASTPGPEPRIAVNAQNTPGNANALFRISQPGSYYLTGNIRGQSGRHGIEIAANGVTLDLMGFEMEGVSGSLNGIRTAAADLKNITIRNGSVRKWSANGVDLNTNAALSSRVEGILANANVNLGITVGNTTVVADCIVTENSNGGMACLSSCLILRCAVHNNSGVGMTMFLGNLIKDCSVNENSFNGIAASGPGNTVVGCCTRANGGSGIVLTNGSTIAECTASGNAVHGISSGFESTIRNNACDSNGTSGVGAGIRTFGSDSRIDSNSCTDNRTGIECVSFGNFIARNTCSGNTTNWVIAANNTCLVINATNAPAINGDSGGISPGSSDPNANFTY